MVVSRTSVKPSSPTSLFATKDIWKKNFNITAYLKTYFIYLFTSNYNPTKWEDIFYDQTIQAQDK